MKTTVVEGAGIRLTIIAPPRDLAPYITAYYRTEVGPDHAVEDFLPPEWTNLRAGRAAVYEAAIGTDPMRCVPPTVISGPTSKVTRLRIRDGQFWGVGLLPMGLAAFIGVPASELADRFCDAARHPSAVPLQEMLEHLVYSSAGIEDDVDLMNAGLRSLLAKPLAQADAILAAHRALVSDDSPSVAAVAVALGVSTRTLERFCARYFGFTPQLLLRRQRFLRSLGKFMVDPSMKWIHSLDSLYHDQAHFVRDFKRFLGMRPSEYAAMPHPIAMTAARGRSAALGDSMQVLHRPLAATAA